MNAVNSPVSSVQPPHTVNASSPRPQPVASRSGPAFEGGIERRPSASYGHHRQTSIVHGIQHSRNASFATSPAISPLSPEIIAAVGAGVGGASDFTTNTPQMEAPELPPSLPLHSRPNGSISSNMTGSTFTSGTSSITVTQKKTERMLSGGKNRHHHSHSRHHHQAEQKTVGEYALHVLFNSFLGHAERKINQCITNPLGPEPHIEEICGPGADPSFDQLISALGHIARQKPKPLIDTLMFWRKAKSEAANAARMELNQVSHSPRLRNNDLSTTFQHKGMPAPVGMLPRRNTEPAHMLPDSASGNAAITVTPPMSLSSRQGAVAQSERQSTISIYLLCRVLIEIIGQSTLACVTPEMADKLEDIIFGQLRAADPEQLSASPLRMTNWTLFGQLLGVMSDINFESVSDRFFADLERSEKELGAKGPTSKEVEGRMELVIIGMSYLRIKTYPEEDWDRSCDFMLSLGKFFVNSHGQRIKHAYCRILEKLLLPIASTARAELNVPKWRQFIDTVNSRLSQMVVKPRHWLDAFPLMSIMLCCSPSEVFSNQWIQFISPLQSKLKDRITRGAALQAICRLVWTYIYRCPDTLNITVKKLEDVIKLVFPAGKKSYLSTESSVAEPLIQLIRIIGFKHQDLCFRTIVFPLINSELFASGRELKVEQLEPEKMVIGIRAFLTIMADLEKGEEGRPQFPQSFARAPLIEKLPISPLTLTPQLISRVPSDAKVRGERLSRPVIISGLGDTAKEYYSRFCEILGKITIICDNTFGGQAVLDEKFSAQPPKTPIAETFSFGRKDDHQAIADQKQGFYDLLHVAVQALPRCLSAHIPFNSLVNLLCTGTAHVQSNIAASSAQSLKSIARQAHAQQVTIGFARFIFNFDDRYSTMSDGGMLGPGHIENTLKLYVELLQIWIEEIRQKSKGAAATPVEDHTGGNRGAQLDLSGVWAYVDELESHGLFFLCSQSRRVRTFAVTVLRLITEFDAALGADNTRIIHILEGDATRVMDFNDEHLSVAERSRLQRGMRRSHSQNTLIELCGSDDSYDATLWFKVFPNLIRVSFEKCPFAVTLGREIVCARLQQMQRGILALTESSRAQYAPFDLMPNRSGARSTPTRTPPEVMIEQYKLYLIVACTTLTNTGSQQQPTQPTQHSRKGSKSSQLSPERISSARSLFGYIIPLLSAGNSGIRDAVVVALGSINVNLYKTLLESLQNAVIKCNEEARLRMHQRTASSPRRSRRTDRLRTEIAHVYKLTSHFLREEEVYKDDWVLSNLVTYTKDLKILLNDAEVQNDWEYQKLRRHYCGLMEELFEGINRTKDPSRWMPFEARKSAFALMEEWCGYSPNQNQIQQREENMKQSIVDQQKDGDRGRASAAMEIEKRSLRTAALSAMASLCGGPISVTTESRSNLQFDVRRMLSWIDTIFNTPSDKMHKIGRRALRNLIVHNKSFTHLLERSIQMCYVAASPKALESFFEVVTEVLIEHPDYPLPFSSVLGAGLFTLGNDKSEIRSKSALLLRTLEERQQKSSKIQDFDISISDKTTAVYKLAQFEISKRLTKQHSELAFLVFSEFTKYFKNLDPNHQRNMVAAILPWIQTIELQLDPNGGPTAVSYMLLANLFEITIKFSNSLHNEVQALWQALATGPHAGNVQLVLDFIMSLCLDKREQNFVDFAKQIVVFLSSTPAGLKVVEFLLLRVTPKAMVQEKREPRAPPPEALKLPYLADLNLALPVGNKQAGFSLGQLSLILLVDLMVSPVQLVADSVPLLLQVVLVLWDHYTPLVQDQAREMLIHLIHELVISKIEDETTTPNKKAVEDFIESVRRHEPKTVWAHDENSETDDSGNKVPRSMMYLAVQVVDIFTIAFPGIKEQWGKTALNWATSCSVRHLACRSFQIFRCILTSLDQGMLSDMLARLSNTIADDETDIQTFSMEILITLETIVGALDPADLLQYPQLFWSTCACLNTIHESEFIESLSMLQKLLDKLDLGDAGTVNGLVDCHPAKWEGSFDGLQPLIYKGLRSAVSFDKSLRIMDQLILLPSNELVGDDSRLLFAVLANLPRFLHSMDEEDKDKTCIECAERLASVAEAQGCTLISRTFTGFANSRYRTSKDFLAQSVSAIRESYLPEWDLKVLVFLMGLLTNRLPWFKLKTMQLLCVMIPDIDMRKSEIASHGPDLISPLLRLLQTEFCPKALEVLDQIMTMSGTPMDKHHLRMSMAGGSQSRAIRKEYERTQSLFGIPEDSGWSIPMPAIHSATTRANVHAVFYTCGNPETADDNPATTSDVEFHHEDFPYGYSGFQDRTGTMMSDEGRGDGNMGELVMKLDSLDNFFDDNLAEQTQGNGSQQDGTGFSTPVDASAQLYDQQTLPILHKSLARTASVTSFQTGFTDLRTPPLRDPGVMTPTAFTAPPVPQLRPGPQSRSLTSLNFHTSTGVEYLSDDDDDIEEEALSEEEEQAVAPGGTHESSFFLENMIRPLAQGTRLGMRRLTGGGSKEKERQRDLLRAEKNASSLVPKSPKVPEYYLRDQGQSPSN
ncbi:MAG: Cell morphogenesis protein PAG1 [Geoglossum umbratile]|nr:MAG: Cell morphogenesis protein PAG1 [Geoglossum umbratile]